MLALERLRIASIGAPASGVTDMADSRRAVLTPHDRFKLGPVVEAKRLGHGSEFFVSLEESLPTGMEAAHAGGKLTPVLHVQQHSRNQPRHAVDFPGDWCER